jgi:3,4-dihydroxy 2-butanone 4-phosphate synthase / GTP cyclohydrolase II
MVVVVDDEDRENEGDLVMAADAATPESMAFIINHTSGVVCVPMLGEDLDRLDVPMMVARNEDPKGTAYTVSVDAAEGHLHGDLGRRPRHDLPGAGRPRRDPGGDQPPRARLPAALPPRRGAAPSRSHRGVGRPRPARRAPPAGVICEVVNADGTMARVPDLEEFAAEHDLLLVTIEDLIAYRREREGLVERVAEARLPTPYGTLARDRLPLVRRRLGALALLYGEPEGQADVLVRMHSECLTGDVFRSLRCDCGPQLDLAMAGSPTRARA